LVTVLDWVAFTIAAHMALKDRRLGPLANHDMRASMGERRARRAQEDQAPAAFRLASSAIDST
jgi:hypothetical protein